jgi:hypothetical protein
MTSQRIARLSLTRIMATCNNYMTGNATMLLGVKETSPCFPDPHLTALLFVGLPGSRKNTGKVPPFCSALTSTEMPSGVSTHHQNSPEPAIRSASFRTTMCSGLSPASKLTSPQTNGAIADAVAMPFRPTKHQPSERKTRPPSNGALCLGTRSEFQHRRVCAGRQPLRRSGPESGSCRRSLPS